MNEDTRNTIEWASKASLEGNTHFADIIKALLAAGVESYHTDYRANRKTYYVLGDEVHADTLPPPDVPIAQAFDSDAVHAAVVGAQKGEVRYPAFLAFTRAAGCIGYIVWLAGRHVTYFGRNGETLVERFPQ